MVDRINKKLLTTHPEYAINLIVMQEREAAVRLVMDLVFALRAIGGEPSNKDLVKLAKRIRYRVKAKLVAGVKRGN